MSSKLVIVESPSKSKTIGQYLGSEYKVLSSKGHIRDLAISGKGGLGIDIENNFKPQYEIIKDKKQIVNELKKAAVKADEIYLATDPDREGEAISWHLKETLNLNDKPTHRVIFNEITKDRVKEAFANPRDIDYNLVSSQETRRILDRIIGFKLSKLLQSKIKSKSAGRVQSATLKIIVDREREIQKFVPEEYWKVKAIFPSFEAELVKINDKKAKLTNEDETNNLVNQLNMDFLVAKVTKKTRKRETKLPFITSTLQQEASTKLNFSSKKTMLIAQRLYEGIDFGTESVGLITYMRTDSTRLSETFINPARKYIKEQFGDEYVGALRKQKSKKNIQDAHEAIRPTDIFRHPKSLKKYLSRDEYLLYKLIYNRTLAALMKPAQILATEIELTNEFTLFKATAQDIGFDGYLKVYPYDKVQISKLPELSEGTILHALDIAKTQHFTAPKARFTEARLIKEMEELGIGRPSTYSQTITILKNRKYVKMEDKKFVPTEQGILTVKSLEKFFLKIITVDYTARMERVLDDISVGKLNQTDIISSFYHSFIPLIEKANANMEKLPPKLTGEKCPLCGHDMVYRSSKYGTFEACGNYPKCKYIKKDETVKKEVVSTKVKCPSCKTGEIVERVAKKGRNKGKKFYACNNYPRCKYTITYKPTGETCPECGSLLVTKDDGQVICSNFKECEYRR